MAPSESAWVVRARGIGIGAAFVALAVAFALLLIGHPGSAFGAAMLMLASGTMVLHTRYGAGPARPWQLLPVVLAPVAAVVALEGVHPLALFVEVGLGAVALFVTTFDHRAGALAQLCSLSLASYAASALVGSADPLRGSVSSARPWIPVLAALGGVAMATALALARPGRGLVALLAADGPGGAMARRLIAPSLLVPVLLSWLKLRAVERGHVDVYMGAQLIAMVFSVALVALVVSTAQRLEAASVEQAAVLASLGASEERFRRLVDSMDDLVFTLDPELRVTALFGRGAERLAEGGVFCLGRPVPALFEADPAELTRAARRALAGQPTSVQVGSRLPGKGRCYTVSLAPLRVGENGALGLVGVARDVTAEVALQARVDLADRMASLGRLAAGVGHEINNPLQYVMANVGFVRRALTAASTSALPRRDDLLQMLEDAREGSERIAKIVSDVASLSRAEEEWIQSVDVLPAIEAAIGVATHELRHHAQLERHFAPVPPVQGSRSRLTQVFLNLLMNAAQAIPAGTAAQHRVSVSVGQEGGRVVVAVADTGVGMSAEVMARVFDPFFTTKGVGEGTGLGLAICHGIVTRIGGEITVESEPGKGTTFRVFLPVAPGAAAVERAAPPVVPALPRLRVLVIDDEPLVCQAIARLLDGHEVHTTTSAAEALRLLGEGAGFDAILCDLMMPDMGAVEFSAALAARLPQLAPRVVYITGGALTAETTAFLAACARPTLTKPIGAAALHAALRELVPAAP